MGKVIKLPQKRIYKPDVSRKIKDGLENGDFTMADLELARKVRNLINSKI